ncbi:MAG: histidine kinase, partial [Paucimonas sp.]|nr:histidine kinase [Paucimonas sp.]
MQLIEDVMTQNPVSVSPQETIRRAAETMDDLNVGVLPVCDGPRLVGLLTDRDIVVRAVAAGLSPSEAMVGEAMSVNVHRCFIDQPVDEVLEMMGDLQIRRLPVCDRDTGNLIGIVSLGDMATKHSAGIDH